MRVSIPRYEPLGASEIQCDSPGLLIYALVSTRDLAGVQIDPVANLAKNATGGL